MLVEVTFRKTVGMCAGFLLEGGTKKFVDFIFVKKVYSVEAPKSPHDGSLSIKIRIWIEGLLDLHILILKTKKNHLYIYNCKDCRMDLISDRCFEAHFYFTNFVFRLPF